MRFGIQNLTLGSLFIALGILLPIVFHAAGLGSFFLPMFWPMALAGFYLKPWMGTIVGISTPLLSSFLTGMPPFPIGYQMAAELAVLSSGISILYSKRSLGNFWIVFAGLLMSRIAGWFAALAIAGLLGLPPKFYALASLLKGMPGIICILLFIPLLQNRIRHDPAFGKRNSHVISP